MAKKAAGGRKKVSKKWKGVGFIPSHDLTRSEVFYRQTLGFKVQGKDDFALILNAHGMMIRVVSLQGFKPAAYTLLGWEVSNIGKEVDGLRKKGVLFQRYEGMKQDSRGIWKAPGGGQVTWFKDPDGNVLSLTQES